MPYRQKKPLFDSRKIFSKTVENDSSTPLILTVLSLVQTEKFTTIRASISRDSSEPNNWISSLNYFLKNFWV